MDKPLEETHFHIAFSKQTSTDHLIPKIMQILKQMKQRGAAENLVEDYFSSQN